MKAVGGIDIGNSTTEIVLAVRSDAGLQPVAYRKAPTKGAKGSDASVAGAAQMIAEAEQHAGLRCERFAVAPLHAVETTLVAEAASGNVSNDPPLIENLASDSPTPAGQGHAIGTLVHIADINRSPDRRELVVAVGRDLDFETASSTISEAIESGLGIVGVVCEGDDATLIANRLPKVLPIVDEVEVARLRTGDLVALEVAVGEAPRLADAFVLSAIFHISSAHLYQVAAVARALSGQGSLALVNRGAPATVGSAPTKSTAHEAIEGWVRPAHGVTDVYRVKLDAVDDGAWMRRGLVRTDQAAVALLRAGEPRDVSDYLGSLLDRPVSCLGTETLCAAVGARTTPGCPADAVVCDLGGGTIDIIAAHETFVGAGAGELLVVAAAGAMRWPRSLAEAAIRRPSFRVQSPHIGHDEYGRRRWLENPAPAEVIGQLCIENETGLSALSRTLAPEQWYGMRKALKRAVLGANVERIGQRLRNWPTAMVVAGGVAEDTEVVTMIAESLRLRGTVVGRANVAGRFGPRAAVAWGQALMAADAGAAVAA